MAQSARPVVTVVVTVVLALLLAASPVAGQETILVDGSTGVMPLVAALAKAYRDQVPDVTVQLGRGLNPVDRLRAVEDATIDIALASHGANADDLARRGLVAHEVAKIAVVFGVHEGVTIAGLSERQVCDIYAATVTSWQALGGPALPVAARARPESEVDTEIVRARLGCLRDLTLPDVVRRMPRSGDMAKELATTPGAIGFTTMTVVEQSGGRIKALALNGITPTADHVRTKAYTLTRDSLLITRATPSAAVRRFVDFIRSGRGAAVIEGNGAIPVR